MLTLEQQELRATGLGSSEIAAVVGLNPFKTRYDVYCVKRGVVADEQRDALAIRIGHICEGLTAELYAEESRATLEPGRTIVHPSEPWALATPDRFVVGADRLVELKWVGWRMCAAWSREEDGVPDYVRCQAEWQMLVSGRSTCDVAALLGGEEFRIYRIEHHAELAARLVEIASRFWHEHVLPGNPPPVDGSDGARRMLEAVFRQGRPELVHATSSIESWVERYMTAAAALKEAEARKAEAVNHLCEFIGKNDADGIQSAHGRCYWRRPAKGKSRRFIPKFKDEETA